VGDSGLVQVAEQYPYLPRFVALQHLVESRSLGEVTSVQLSWTHGYHQIALLRRLLGARFDTVEVAARSFSAPALRSLHRTGWPEAEELIDAEQTVATLDFGGRLGLYDFTIGQWFHPLMRRRSAVRGTHGEVVDDSVTRMVDSRTPVTSSLVRRQTGIDGDLEGFDLDTITLDSEVLYRNPFRGARLADEEIAIATVLDRMAAWMRTGDAPPYPLAEACQDHLLTLAIERSAREGVAVTIEREPWADA
jgi:predicted dehydrogenase